MTDVNVARAQRTRRRRILGWIPYALIAVGVIALVVATIGFNNSWWVKAHPRASAQQSVDGQSIFTQAGIDYSARVGAVKISLAQTRPSAVRLGLPRAGSHTASYIVPVTITVSAGGTPIRESLASGVRLDSSANRVTAVHLSYDASAQQLHQTALQLIGTTGTTSDQAAFEASFNASQDASSDRRYDAKSITHSEGMAVVVEFTGTPKTSQLRVTLSPG